MEKSVDLEQWQVFDTENPHMLNSYSVPEQTTYYRRVAFTSTGETVCSNIACYSTRQRARITTRTACDSAGDRYTEDIACFDGLGRPLAAVAVGASTSGRNLVIPFAYDAKGRQTCDFLPYAADSEPFSAGTAFLLDRQERYHRAKCDTHMPVHAYAERVYDNSPLDRPVRVFRPGSEYRGDVERFTDIRCELNTAADGVLHLCVASDGALRAAGEYAAGLLRKTVLRDEDGARQESYTDPTGREILVRQWISDDQRADTYSVYDALGRLRWVLSPEGSARLTPGCVWSLHDAIAEKYCYRYLYDGSGNVALRCIPGRAPDRMTYDAAGRVVTSCNGAQRARNVRLRYRYDPLGRIVELALQPTESDPAESDPAEPDPADPTRPWLDDSLKLDPGIILPFPDPDPVVPGPVFPDPIDPVVPIIPPGVRPVDPEQPFVPLMASAPTGVALSQPITRWYYDDYRPVAGFSLHDFAAVEGVTEPAGPSPQVRGLMTREAIRAVSDGEGTDTASGDWLRRTCYYDARGRVIQTVETDPDGRLLRTSCGYDYLGNVLVRDEMYRLSAADSVRIRFRYEYDGRSRLLRERVSVGSQEFTDVGYVYDDLGRLRTMRSPNGFRVDYTYNLQGWLTRIDYGEEQGQLIPDGVMASFPIFSQHFNYFNPACAPARYTGDIAEIHWMRGQNLNDARMYGCEYDGLHRLTEASYYAFVPRRGDFTSPPYELTNRFTERGMRYDRNGNLLALTRHDGDSVFRYTFRRDGNRLAAQTLARAANSGSESLLFADSTTTRNRYDTLGRRIFDGAAELELCFDDNDRPQSIKSAASASESVNYRYLWNGEKFAATDASGDGYCYRGSGRYGLADGTARLESVPFSMGRIVRDGSAYSVHYFVTDHLGSVRTILDSEHRILAEYDYHPFGSQHTNPDLAASSNDYRFSGKELQERFAVPYYDFGARLYDCIDWGSPDVLSEKYRSVGVYVYCAGNPISRIDPNGKKWVDAKGNEVWKDGEWTEYATEEMKALGNTLRKTKTGEEQFKKLVENEAEILIVISDEVQDDVYGKMEAKGGVTTNQKTGKAKINSGAVITTYRLNAKERSLKHNGFLTPLEAMAVNIGHEIEHTTDENIWMNLMKNPDIELKPKEISVKLIKEFESQKTIILEGYNIFGL